MDAKPLPQLGGFPSVFLGALGYTKDCQRDRGVLWVEMGVSSKAAPYMSV